MKRILLVEDEPGYCELLEEAFSRQPYGHAVQIKHDVTSALALLQNEPVPPDLLVLDLRLKDHSGTELLRVLRTDARFTCVPVVILSASADPTDVRTCYALGANGYVVKPDTLADLVSLADDLCRYWLRWNHSLRSVAQG